MRALIRNLSISIFLIAISAIAGPYIENTLYALRIAAMPVPRSFDMPVANVSPASLRDSWHAPREGGRRRHEGIDIFAPRGTQVRATTEGIVLRVGRNNLGGKVVWLLGPGCQRHYYAHLDRFAGVHAGMRIDAGTVIGYVGNSGNAAGTPPHLHYGVYTPKGAVNPYPFLRSATG
jgi:murein DD-endopeptidase MepM/ murein hydrolase activator NlpD